MCLLLCQRSVDGVLSGNQAQGPIVRGGREVEKAVAGEPLVVLRVRSHYLKMSPVLFQSEL